MAYAVFIRREDDIAVGPWCCDVEELHGDGKVANSFRNYLHKFKTKKALVNEIRSIRLLKNAKIFDRNGAPL